VAGDFNARSPAWGDTRRNSRGQSLEDWMGGHGLSLLNVGRVSTCVRPQGESVIDITMASPSAAHKVSSWRVVDDLRGETLSDHRYIEIVLGTACQQVRRPTSGGEKRWVLTKLDGEKLETALMATSWGLRDEEGEWDIHQEVEWLRGNMHRICDESMPRTKSHPPRRATYWWTDELAELRRSSVEARRAVSRIPRDADPDAREEALAAYRNARCALSHTIRKSREKCWDELLSSLNTDPWGRPYKIVLKRHRAWTPPATETMEPRLLGDVVDALFPQWVEGSTLEWGPDLDGPYELAGGQLVSAEELSWAVRKIGSRKAPGPDGIPGRIWVRALDFLGARLGHIFNKCLKQGQFPQQWKKAKLVLLP